jgi:heme oxygenase (biliverdin-IX-beta and delta-forming)
MDNEAAWAARLLLRATRMGSLATTDNGQPFVSLVTPATAPDLSPLLLLSDLSPHTRHLKADPSCALLVIGPAPEPNPQTAPRVTIAGTAEPISDTTLKSRYLAIHPYATLYADFADFHLWRISITGAAYVGGFARAARLTTTELAPDPAAVAAIAAAEAATINRCNQDHPDALVRTAGEPGTWKMVAIDTDGCDLAQGEHIRRVPWSAPAADPAAIRRQLVALAG